MHPHKNHPQPSAGFSLIELMCVMAILLILFALSFGIGGKTRQRSRQEECRQNMQFVHQALKIAAAENNERYPVVKNATDSNEVLAGLVPKYSSRVDMFRCPGRTRDPFTAASATTTRFRNHFAYAMGLPTTAGADQWLLSDDQVNTKPKAAGDALFSETDQGRGSNHGKYGGSVLFADGHAEESPSKSKFVISVPAGGSILNPKY